MLQDQNHQKISLKECVFVNSELKKQYHIVKKYTPTDWFLGDFTHWKESIIKRD